MSQATAPSLPAALAPAALLERLQWRYAVKKFDASRKIPADTWAALEEVLRLAPSSYGLQPWRFVVVQDKALRETLRAASWNQAQITEASHMVVFAARRGIGVSDVERFVDSIVEQRGVTREALAGYARTIRASSARRRRTSISTRGPRGRPTSRWASSCRRARCWAWTPAPWRASIPRSTTRSSD